MKILLINSVCGYGSTGRIVIDLAKTYLAHGHQCIIAYGRDSFSEESEKQIKMEFPNQCTFYQIGGRMHKINNIIHGIESRILDNHGFASYYPTKQFVSWLEEEKPDVIHLHNLHGYYIHVGVLFDYIKKHNIKTIWTLHDCWGFTGHCTYYDYAQCDRWKKEGCSHCPQKKEYPASLFLDCSQHNFEAKKKVFQGVEDLTLVTPSCWLKKQVEQSILSGYPCEVIHNGIDLEVFCPKNVKNDGKIKEDELEKKRKYIVLGVASVWNQRKGLSCFISLAKKLPENYQIVLIGLNEKKLQELERKKETKEYLRKIQGVLRTNSVNELAEYYRNADVFVNPTLEDNFPTTNLEALACGTPVITYQTGGSPECLAGEEKAGRVIEKGNKKVLIEEIRKMCEKPESEKQKQKELCCKQASKFGKQEKYEEYIKLLHVEEK